MPRKSQPPVPDPEELTARIQCVRQNYYISRTDGRGGKLIDDEAAIEIEGIVETISKRHRKHVGQRISISLLHAVRYTEGKPDVSAFFGSVTFRGAYRSALAYVPADPFWRIPGLIDRGANIVELRFSPTWHGFGELLSLYVADKVETQF